MTAEEILRLLEENKGKFYCYTLSKPDGTPFYVGAGRDKRIFAHEKQARGKTRSRKLSTIRKITTEGGSINYAIVGFYDNWSDAIEEEKSQIAKHGRKDLGTGTLTNLTEGGDGANGFSKEILDLLSAQKKGKPLSEKHVDALKAAWHTPAREAGIKNCAEKLTGRKASEATREKLRISHIGIKPSKEALIKRSIALTGKRHSAETKAKMSKDRTGKPVPEAAHIARDAWMKYNRQTMSDVAKANWQSDGYREKMTKALTGVKRSEQYCAENKIRQIKKFEDPVWKAKWNAARLRGIEAKKSLAIAA